MLPLRYRRRWRIAGYLLLIAVLGATLAPAVWPWFGQPPSGWPLVDKWMHGFTFAALAIWYTGQYARRSYGWLALGLLIFGGLVEAGQSMVPYRTAEVGDLVADMFGIAAGMMIALMGAGGWCLRVEGWIQNRFG